MVTDTVRALLFPITMLFGPFVNDAVANVGKIGSGEVTKLGALCSLSASRKQEIEADMVSTRFAIPVYISEFKPILFFQQIDF
jgi:hypothetical protein